MYKPTVVYEDNHLLCVSKRPGEIVQGDKTGDEPMSEALKAWLKEKYNKPGNVYLGVIHRLDRPVGGLVLFAKTSKALSRMNELFRTGDVSKRYWAVVTARPPKHSDTLEQYLVRNESQNKSYVARQGAATPGAKLARLSYRLLASGEHYHLLEIELHTGRHHQIRCQLAALGCPIKGDLKYGAPRSNPGGSISLLSRQISFTHPVSKEALTLTAPVPDERLWHDLEATIAQ
ncbi:RNA pseudouridine synthase [Porphyromonas sp. oral taxon 279 str. F0450]|uniref:RluA family pseudouridine synthase n=1 Tax=Porphyromonas sp. oral taxon 279 TaxID=712438 RepID=UPI00027C4A66|nr:RluA family pseudouridine synthase [Porphyromonas sp. oral taxon 279]EJU16059.1 RNA pseudouridine synthase [Porphyromonas sp. oral taxon 279 str. F0450]